MQSGSTRRQSEKVLRSPQRRRCLADTLVETLQRHRFDLPEPERLTTEAIVLWSQDSVGLALERARQFIERYPNSWFGWLIYPDQLLHSGPSRSIRTSYRSRTSDDVGPPAALYLRRNTKNAGKVAPREGPFPQELAAKTKSSNPSAQSDRISMSSGWVYPVMVPRFSFCTR
jgi:hypothetical protein